jgi:hypothetical protein
MAAQRNGPVQLRASGITRGAGDLPFQIGERVDDFLGLERAVSLADGHL